MNPRVLAIALAIAATAMGIAATIDTLDWNACVSNHGGKECKVAKADATGSWKAFAFAALAFVTNTVRKPSDES